MNFEQTAFKSSATTKGFLLMIAFVLVSLVLTANFSKLAVSEMGQKFQGVYVDKGPQVAHSELFKLVENIPGLSIPCVFNYLPKSNESLVLNNIFKELRVAELAKVHFIRDMQQKTFYLGQEAHFIHENYRDLQGDACYTGFT